MPALRQMMSSSRSSHVCGRPLRTSATRACGVHGVEGQGRVHPSDRDLVAVGPRHRELHGPASHAVETPQGCRGDVRHHRLWTEAEQAGQQLLLPGGRGTGNSQNARFDGFQRSDLEQVTQLVDRAAELEHLVPMDEGELRSGPLGDGPVQMTDHRHSQLTACDTRVAPGRVTDLGTAAPLS